MIVFRKNILFQFILFSFLFIACSETPHSSEEQVAEVRDSLKIELKEFQIKNTTIRALEVLNDSTVWFGGSNGHWGYTEDNGKSWHVDSLFVDDKKLEIRSIEVLESGAVLLVGVANPAIVLRTEDKGLQWEIVYQDTSQSAFFDAVKFNGERGFLLGDAQNGCFDLSTSKDDGLTWTKVDCENIPVALEGEGPFAASNTNVSYIGNQIWFATGGASGSRVFKSENNGENWKVSETPLIAGQQMTGAFSIQFLDDSLGAVAGGNWESVSDTTANFSISKDGGLTWNAIQQSEYIGYISCIQFIPETSGSEIFALKGRARGGESSMSFSNNQGQSWQTFPNSNYLTIQFVDKHSAWISGKNKIAKLILKD